MRASHIRSRDRSFGCDQAALASPRRGPSGCRSRRRSSSQKGGDRQIGEDRPLTPEFRMIGRIRARSLEVDPIPWTT